MIATILLSLAVVAAEVPTPGKPAPPPAAASAAPTVVPSTSLYLLDAPFEDSDGKRTRLDAHRGHPVLLAMFYATCPMACPMLISDVKLVLSKIDGVEKVPLHVVLVSLDPDVDTPAKLAEVYEKRGVSKAQWTLLRGDKDTTRLLAAALNVRFRKNGDGSIDHTSKIVLLDGNGVIVAERRDIGAPADAFAAAIKRALSAP